MSKDKIMEYYANVPHNIDTRTEGDAQIVLTALWGSVPVSPAGIVNNPVKTLSYECKLSEQKVLAALNMLGEIGQIVTDLGTDELLIREWLENNYLFEQTISESPRNVLLAFEQIKSPVVRHYTAREIEKLDVCYDSTISGFTEKPGDTASM